MSYSATNLQRALGFSRDRTYTFKSFRKQTKTKQSRFYLKIENNENKSEHLLESSDGYDISRSLPPSWVDNYDQLLEDLSAIENTLRLLEKTQNTRLQKAFADTSKNDLEIKGLVRKLTFMIKSVESSTREIENVEGEFADFQVRKNIAQSIALRLHKSTEKFKASQQKYLSKISKMPTEDLVLDPLGMRHEEEGLLVDAQATERTEAIDQMLNDMTDLSEIFKELNMLIVHQGTILDRIDYNIEMTLQHTGKANEQLTKAAEHQKCGRSGICILALLGMILLMGLFLAFKHL